MPANVIFQISDLHAPIVGVGVVGAEVEGDGSLEVNQLLLANQDAHQRSWKNGMDILWMNPSIH